MVGPWEPAQGRGSIKVRYSPSPASPRGPVNSFPWPHSSTAAKPGQKSTAT